MSDSFDSPDGRTYSGPVSAETPGQAERERFAAKMEMLADWFDADDFAKGRAGRTEVQEDLRRWAAAARDLAAQDARPEPGAQWRVVVSATGESATEPLGEKEAEDLAARLNLAAGRNWYSARSAEPQPAPELATLADAWQAKYREYADAGKTSAATDLDYARAQRAIGVAYKKCAEQLTAFLAAPQPKDAPELAALRRPRLKGCVEAWPECSAGEYNPACCRFPKSCSCDAYDDEQVTPEILEQPQPAPEMAAAGCACGHAQTGHAFSDDVCAVPECPCDGYRRTRAASELALRDQLAGLATEMHAEADAIAASGAAVTTGRVRVLHEYASRIRQAIGPDAAREALEGK